MSSFNPDKIIPYTTANEFKKKFPKFDDSAYQHMENESKRKFVIAGTGWNPTKKETPKRVSITYGDYIVKFED